jgi:hypothetical protein
MTRDIKTDYKSYHGVARDKHTSRRGGNGGGRMITAENTDPGRRRL